MYHEGKSRKGMQNERNTNAKPHTHSLTRSTWQPSTSTPSYALVYNLAKTLKQRKIKICIGGCWEKQEACVTNVTALHARSCAQWSCIEQASRLRAASVAQCWCLASPAHTACHCLSVVLHTKPLRQINGFSLKRPTRCLAKKLHSSIFHKRCGQGLF